MEIPLKEIHIVCVMKEIHQDFVNHHNPNMEYLNQYYPHNYPHLSC